MISGRLVSSDPDLHEEMSTRILGAPYFGNCQLHSNSGEQTQTVAVSIGKV